MNITKIIEAHTISSREKVEFIKNFAMMLQSGVAVDEALSMLAEEAETPRFARVLARIAQEVERGSSLSEALRKESHVFGAVAAGLFGVGERSGALDETLLFLSDYLERSYDLEQDVRGATFYPKFIILVTGVIGIFLVGFILPKLVPMFRQLHVTLPLSTRILLAISVFAKSYWFAVVAGIVAAAGVFAAVRDIPRVRFVLDGWWLRVPIFGGLNKEYQLALFAQLFATLLKGNSPVNESLSVAADAASNVRYRQALLRIRDRVEEGNSLSKALKDEPQLFPKKMVLVVATSEQSGALATAFSGLAEYYTKEVARKTKKLPVLIEPILLILIAIVVCFIALAIIMPIYEITRSVSR